MPSGSTVQIKASNDRGGRNGTAAPNGNGGIGVARMRLSSRSQDSPVGGKGGNSGQRDALTTFGNGEGGGGGGGGGRSFSATEQHRLARVSPDEAMDAEVNFAQNTNDNVFRWFTFGAGSAHTGCARYLLVEAASQQLLHHFNAGTENTGLSRNHDPSIAHIANEAPCGARRVARRMGYTLLE